MQGKRAAKPPLQGEADAPHGADGGVRRPALPISFRAGADLSGGRERPPCKVRQACSTAGDDKPPRAFAQGPMVFIGPPAGLMGSGRSSAAARSRPQCRAGDFARRLGFAVWQGLRDDASIVPYGCKARCCQTLQGIPAANRQCTPQSASPPAPLAGVRQLPIKPPLQGEVDAPQGADGGHQPCGCTSGFRPGRRAACHAHRSAAAIPASSAGTGV